VNLLFDDDTLRRIARPLIEEVVTALRETERDNRITLSDDEASKLLGMTRSQLRDRRLAGEVVATKLGNRWFFEVDELRDYARRNRADR
jgi:hypothetical protein